MESLIPLLLSIASQTASADPAERVLRYGADSRSLATRKADSGSGLTKRTLSGIGSDGLLDSESGIVACQFRS